MVTKEFVLALSLFQLKDEPEEAGTRQLRKAPFWFENWVKIISRRAEGMWESRSDFQGLWEAWFSHAFHKPSFPPSFNPCL